MFQPATACSGRFATLVAALAVSRSTAAPNKVTVQGRRVLVNGVPVHLKGANWNPVPLGKVHPEGLDYVGEVERDSKLMQAAGINAVRTYECVCDVGVLDVLWSRGIYVLNTVFANANNPLELVAQKVNAVKNHPAVLMWVAGNEWNYNGCYAGLSHDGCMDYIARAATIAKQHDGLHPVASIYGHLPSLEVVGNLSMIDIWGANFYNGLHFEYEDEEENVTKNLFSVWEERTKLPLFIGEYGSDAWDTRYNREDHAAQAEAVKTLTEDIVSHSSLKEGGVVLGGMIFEWADEWWKDYTGNESTHDSTGFNWGGGPHPDLRFNEEWWGLVDIDRNPRPAYYAYKSVARPSWSSPDAADLAHRGPDHSDRGAGRRLATLLPVQV